MMKKVGVFACLAALILVLGCFTLAEAETSGSCGTGVTWVLDNNGFLTISGNGGMTSHPWTASEVKQVVIEQGVTSIGEYAFRNCSSLTSITIPESVTSIGIGAFFGCSSLTSITIPEGVTSIGSYAFCGLSSLTSIAIPEGVTSIGTYAFDGCSSLTSITIPESVTSIGEYTFGGCSSLTSITIPESVTSIGVYAFYKCSSLTSITIPESVTLIGERAFYDCPAIKYVRTDANAAKVLSKAGYSYRITGERYSLIYLYSGDNITGKAIYSVDRDIVSLTIPEGVTSIGGSAFRDCSRLTSITLPKSVTSIGGSAFMNCSSLTSITIPESVTSIGVYAFYYCSRLKKICFLNQSTEPISIAGDAFYSGMVYDLWPTIYCYEYSYIDSWATREFQTVYLDTVTIQS